VAAQSNRRKFPTTSIRKMRFWRCVPKVYVRTVLEAGPSFTRNRRYSVRGEFGALYFSGSRPLSLEEVAGRVGEDGEVIVCVEFEVTVHRVVDLTRPEARTKLRIPLEDLVRPRLSEEAYEVPQKIARAVYEAKLDGLLVPSVHDPHGRRPDWVNLVLYPANLIGSFVRKILVEEVG
jgi:RES domain-containing protein